jgi:hypothetical protein
MITLADALSEARQKRQVKYQQLTLQWQMAQEVLQAVYELLTSANLPRWDFVPKGNEIVVFHHQHNGTKERVGAWSIDEEYRLAFEGEKTEWITAESWARVIDKAVAMTAEVVLDRETQAIPFEGAVAARVGDPQIQQRDVGS